MVLHSVFRVVLESMRLKVQAFVQDVLQAPTNRILAGESALIVRQEAIRTRWEAAGAKNALRGATLMGAIQTVLRVTLEHTLALVNPVAQVVLPVLFQGGAPQSARLVRQEASLRRTDRRSARPARQVSICQSRELTGVLSVPSGRILTSVLLSVLRVHWEPSPKLSVQRAALPVQLERTCLLPEPRLVCRVVWVPLPG